MKKKALSLLLSVMMVCFPYFIIAQSTGQHNELPKLVPVQIDLQKGIHFKLKIPEGYHINIAYEGLKRLRFLTRSPDGRLFATDMFDLTDNKNSKIYIFDDWDEKLKRFKKIHTYLDNLHNVTQVAFYHTRGKEYIYVPETDKLCRYEYHAGNNAPIGKPEVVATFPAHGLSYKYGGWHLTRSLAFHNKKLYVSVGSSCNACVEKEDVRATILQMEPDGKEQKIFATGLRNSVGIKWIGNKLWATGMGQDMLGLDTPEDIFVQVRKDHFYGWPWYYQYQDKIYPDGQFRDSANTTGKVPGKPSLAYCGFKAHSAPLGFDYFTNFADPLFKNHFLVALHGSTDVALERGNAVVKITGAGKYITIIDGFLTGTTEDSRKGRPCDVMMNDDHSFFITDDMNGVLYYVWK